MLEIPVNTFKALLNFRTAFRQLPNRHEKTDSCLVWIDAICVNQSDIDERGSQVSQMGEIFRNAAAVMIRLGGDESPDVCRQALHSVHELYSLHMHRRDDPSRHLFDIGVGFNGATRDKVCITLDSTTSVYTSTWFERLWTIQESCLAREAWCMFGGGILPLYEITVLADALAPYAKSSWCLHQGIQLVHKRGRVKSTCRERNNIFTVIVATMDFAASDPRDMVYAALGLFSEAYNPIPTQVDYTMTVQEVFARATVQSIMLDKSLVPLQYAGCLSGRGRNDGYPSWVIRLDRAKERKTSPLRPQFSEPDHTWRDVHEMPVSSMWKTLRLEGAVFDEIDTAIQLEHQLDLADESFSLVADWILSMVASVKPGFFRHEDDTESDRSGATDENLRDILDILDDASIESVAQTIVEGICSFQDEDHFEGYVDSLARMLRMVKARRAPSPAMTWESRVEAWKAEHEKTGLPVPMDSVRSFFVTKKGRLGMGPPSIAEKDHVCLFRGATSLFVLRKQGSSWRLMGDAYVHGLRDPSYSSDYLRDLNPDLDFYSRDRWQEQPICSETGEDDKYFSDLQFKMIDIQ